MLKTHRRGQDALNYLNNLKALNIRVNSYIEDSLNSKEAKIQCFYG